MHVFGYSSFSFGPVVSYLDLIGIFSLFSDFVMIELEISKVHVPLLFSIIPLIEHIPLLVLFYILRRDCVHVNRVFGF